MASRRALLATGSLLALAECLNDGASGESVGGAGPSVSSPAFTAGTSIPTRYTCDG